jgi:hypothetical protein
LSVIVLPLHSNLFNLQVRRDPLVIELSVLILHATLTIVG